MTFCQFGCELYFWLIGIEANITLFVMLYYRLLLRLWDLPVFNRAATLALRWMCRSGWCVKDCASIKFHTAGYEHLARYVKLRFVHAPGMPGTFSPQLRVSYPDMPWCMPGSLTSGFLLSRWWGINYPFSQHNIHSMLSYTTFYPQLIRFFRLCNNINGFLFRANLSHSKLVKRGYMHSPLSKYLKIFCLTYKIYKNMARKIITYYSRVWSNTAPLFRVI